MEKEVWISQDFKGSNVLNLRTSKPVLDEKMGFYYGGDFWAGILNAGSFPDITFESGPKKYKLVKCKQNNESGGK